MRLTYSLIKEQFLRNIGHPGSTDANILASFNNSIGQRYQLILAKMSDYTTQEPQTTTSVAGQQYYHYPPGMVAIDSITVTVGSVKYPVETIYGQHSWDLLNALQIQPTSIPQFMFPRQVDFGIWPIPQADNYTITLNAFMRYINMSIDDYTTGTVTVTNGSQTVTGSGTTFTAAMVGRWFVVTDATNTGQGLWYRVSEYTSATEIQIESYFQGASGSGLTFRIGQSPEIPEEGHVMFIDGATADYYFGLRDDTATAQAWENKFYTGDRTNTSRDVGNKNIVGGLVGMMNRYSARDTKHLIRKAPQPFLPQYQVWGTTIS